MAKNQTLVKDKAIPRKFKGLPDYAGEVSTPASTDAPTLVEQELDKLASVIYSYRLITQRLAHLHDRLTGAEDSSVNFPEIDLDRNNVLQTLRNINDSYENNIDVASKILNEINVII